VFTSRLPLPGRREEGRQAGDAVLGVGREGSDFGYGWTVACRVVVVVVVLLWRRMWWR